MKNELDFNLLKVLILLNEHKKLKNVSKVLGKSEASVSKYLARLREQFDDELFTLDSHNGYEPTNFMLSVLPEIEHGLLTLNHALQKKQFDPESVTKEIVLAMSQHAQFFWGHIILKQLRALFPNASFRFTTWNDDSPIQIINEEIDIGIYIFMDELSKSVYQKKLCNMKYEILVPEHLSHLTPDEVYQLPFIIPTARGWQQNNTSQEKLMAQKDIQLNVIAYLDNITNILKTINEIDGATILGASKNRLPGYVKHSIQQDTSDIFTPVVALMKVKNRQNPFHLSLIRVFESVIKSEAY